MLDVGVKKVIWIMSDSKNILVAKPNEAWLLVNWWDDVEVFDGLRLHLTQLLKEEGNRNLK